MVTFHGRACNSHSLSTTFRVGIDRIGAGTSTENNNNNINSINYRQLHSYSRSCEGFPSHLHIKVNRSDSSSRLHRIKYPTPPVSQVRPRTHAAPINPPFLEHRLKNIPLLEYLIPQSPPARKQNIPFVVALLLVGRSQLSRCIPSITRQWRRRKSQRPSCSPTKLNRVYPPTRRLPCSRLTTVSVTILQHGVDASPSSLAASSAVTEP